MAKNIKRDGTEWFVENVYQNYKIDLYTGDLSPNPDFIWIGRHPDNLLLTPKELRAIAIAYLEAADLQESALEQYSQIEFRGVHDRYEQRTPAP